MSYEQFPQPNPEVEPAQSDDQIIESILGVSLPKEQALPRRRLTSLLKDIQTGVAKERGEMPDEQYLKCKAAENEYIKYKARTVYSVISQLPERNGLTYEDYFQIGCEVVLEDARSRPIPQPGDRRSTAETKIYPKIRNACNQAAVDMLREGAWRGALETRIDEEEELTPYSEEAVPGNFMDPYTETERAEIARAIQSALSKLPDRNRRILELRYGLGDQQGETKTKVEVGKKLKVTRQNIQQIEARILKNLSRLGELDFSEHGTDEQAKGRRS